MTIRKAFFILAVFCLPTWAQDTTTHKFFDKTNVALFSLHATATAWDAHATEHGTTPHFIETGGCVPRHDVAPNCVYMYGAPEGDPLAQPFVKQGTPGIVTFFAGEVACNMAGAYLLPSDRPPQIRAGAVRGEHGISLRAAHSWHGVR